MHATAYAVLYTIPAITALGLSIPSFSRHRQGGRAFGIMLVALGVRCGGHAISLVSPDLPTALFWQQISALGGVAIGPAWLLLALAWCGVRPTAASRALALATMGIAALFAAAILTNESHHLWWSAAYSAARPGAAIELTRGPIAWVGLAISYCYTFAGVGVLIRYAARSGQRRMRWVALIALAPLFASVASLFWPRIWPVDEIGPLISSATVFLLFSIWFPASQQIEHWLVALFEQASDGLLFLGGDGTIDSLNAAARQILGVPTGQPIAHLAQIEARLGDAILTASSQPQREICDTYATAYGQREIQIRAVPIEGKKGQQLIRLRDATEQQATRRTRDIYEQHLDILRQIGHATNEAASSQPLQPIAKALVSALRWDRAVIGLLQQDENTLHLVVDVPSTAKTLEGRFIDSYLFGNIVDMLKSTAPQVLQVDSPALVGTPTEAVLQCLDSPTVLCVPLHSARKPIGMLFLGSTTIRSLLPDELKLMELVGTLVSNTIVRSQLYTSAQQAEAIKSSFLATISHELRTPLTSMLGFIDMLKANVFGPMPESSLEAFAHIEQSSRSLHQLIDDMIDLAKMEAGHMAVELYPVNIELVLYMVVQRWVPQLKERGLTLREEIEPDLPLIQANSARLEQVLNHILSNALKFSSAGEITIRVHRYDSMVAISVRDSGIGIAKANQQQVFEAFSQVEPTLTRRYGGAGIGLAISKHLMALMGGTITLESELGAGSVFRCCFHTAFTEARLASSMVVSEEPSYLGRPRT